MNIPFSSYPPATHLTSLIPGSGLTKPSAMLLKLVVKQLLVIKPSTILRSWRFNQAHYCLLKQSNVMTCPQRRHFPYFTLFHVLMKFHLHFWNFAAESRSSGAVWVWYVYFARTEMIRTRWRQSAPEWTNDSGPGTQLTKYTNLAVVKDGPRSLSELDNIITLN